jgi:hypothetical protein
VRFVFVHGGFHAAWCWDHTIVELERRGDVLVGHSGGAVTERLGVEQLTIDTSHSPFLSRPVELAELLVHATTTTPVGPLQPD